MAFRTKVKQDRLTNCHFQKRWKRRTSTGAVTLLCSYDIDGTLQKQFRTLQQSSSQMYVCAWRRENPFNLVWRCIWLEPNPEDDFPRGHVVFRFQDFMLAKVILPPTRLQLCNLSMGLVLRMFFIVLLQVDTASSCIGESWICGISDNHFF